MNQSHPRSWNAGCLLIFYLNSRISFKVSSFILLWCQFEFLSLNKCVNCVNYMKGVLTNVYSTFPFPPLGLCDSLGRCPQQKAHRWALVEVCALWVSSSSRRGDMAFIFSNISGIPGQKATREERLESWQGVFHFGAVIHWPLVQDETLASERSSHTFPSCFSLMITTWCQTSRFQLILIWSVNLQNKKAQKNMRQ